MTIELDAYPTTPTVRVASVPAGHPYVARISASPSTRLLPDPPVPGAAKEVWWPPVALEPAWIQAHRSHADLLHIHFGTESFPPGHLTACVEAAHAVGWPVVFTVHDLDHPQLADQTAYHRQLDELIPAADAVITLTVGASAAIAHRWGREAIVLAHPALLDSSCPLPDVPPHDGMRIGVHLNDLRPNVDGPAAVRVLSEALALLHRGGIAATSEVWMRRTVRNEHARDHVRELCSADPHLSLVEHERLSDEDLVAALGALDVCVLPYRHGTHSGWLELCWDLGVPVAAPDVGYYAQQHPDGVRAFDRGDPASLADALSALTGAFPTAGSRERTSLVAQRTSARVASDQAVVDAHLALYRRVLAEWGV